MTPPQRLRSVYLHPGEIAVVQEPTLISTVLGSCISLTFFHPARKLAGICHALLPHGGSAEELRYVDGSARHLLKEFLHRGIPREQIEIKLFGGADMFESYTATNSASVGRQNVKAAIDFVTREELRVIASDTGGHQGRKLLFYSHTGEIFLKRLRRQEIPPACR